MQISDQDTQKPFLQSKTEKFNHNKRQFSWTTFAVAAVNKSPN